MKKITKQKWIDALRSGRFEQCFGNLTVSTGASCVLGVLNRITGGTGHAYPRCVSESFQNKLVELNDKNRYTFHQLANYISRNLKTED